MTDQLRLDNSRDIAKEVAKQLGGNYGLWENYHPIVKATIEWLDEHNYLAIVKAVDDD